MAQFVGDYQSVVGNNLTVPPTAKWAAPQSGTAVVTIKIVNARNLIAADLNGKSDPFVRVRVPGVDKKKAPTTKVIQKNLNPDWNEVISVKLSNPRTDVIVLEVYDKDKIGEDLIGYTAIHAGLLPYEVEVFSTEKLSYVPHGELTISMKANFGLFEYPTPRYLHDYTNWRNNLPPVSKNGKAKNDKKHKSAEKKNKTAKAAGPFPGDSALPKGYHLKNGFVKKEIKGVTLKDGKKTAKGAFKVLKTVGKVMDKLGVEISIGEGEE
ncbi:hypothetical protein DLAC_04218 [Tieghemostelium lacteum]|uniref:C2 domain-containing protein n=1 Tax=Tieghemostelium lacteum TaxID=361077 RepID=A0A151ZS96_TIELA|nr:hypothetical protein DLAC_04218 [Tieghemostelium lacteum]|eukprot:KYQ96901.1 hypothetical protein DLAC_04218 [Tieghemostelium lacteum]